MSIVLKEKITPNNFVNYSENGKFIKPKIKIKINYLEKTKGNMLRHPFMWYLWFTNSDFCSTMKM